MLNRKKNIRIGAFSLCFSRTVIFWIKWSHTRLTSQLGKLPRGCKRHRGALISLGYSLQPPQWSCYPTPRNWRPPVLCKENSVWRGPLVAVKQEPGAYSVRFLTDHLTQRKSRIVRQVWVNRAWKLQLGFSWCSLYRGCTFLATSCHLLGTLCETRCVPPSTWKTAQTVGSAASVKITSCQLQNLFFLARSEEVFECIAGRGKFNPIN